MIVKKNILAQAILYISIMAAMQPAFGSTQLKGVVTSTKFTPGSATEPVIAASYWQGALICVDANNNGKCDATEHPVKTGKSGAFSLPVEHAAALIADIGTHAASGGDKNKNRTVYRASIEQVQEQGHQIVLSPLSTEVVRLMEADGSAYQIEKQHLADRLSVSPEEVLNDINKVKGKNQTALLNEAHLLDHRFVYAITKLDRGDLYPDALAVSGGDPELTGMRGVTAATATVQDARKPITFLQAEQASFNIEGIPRYDSIFIVMLENKSTSAIAGSAYAPNINKLMKAGNQAISYYATGNPSEPNYTALGGADDFGIIDDDQWNCNATGANTPTDAFLPTNTHPGLAGSPFKPTATASCDKSAVSHNIIGQPNLFNAITASGMTWRTYSESMNPGQDTRTDSVADATVVAHDHVYQPGTAGGNTTAIGNPDLLLPLPADLYRTKHHPGMPYQNVRSAPEWQYSNRTLGGGQWDSALKNSKAYAIPANYDYDQFSTDLSSGKVGNLNFVIPDQCDDMHGIEVEGQVNGARMEAGDCSTVANNVSAGASSPIVTRGDNYVAWVVKKIQSSALWKNQNKKVAIVIMFDEGDASSGYNGAAGWNPGKAAHMMVQRADGSWLTETAVNSEDNYARGNRGHGESIFVVLNNQPKASKSVIDSDAYSHFSFVRTLQDMFLLADPAKDSSYMGRSKYTEKYIAQNRLPEYVGSADTHFDSVRPMNHAFVIPANYLQKQSSDMNTAPQTGPDSNQTSIWAIK